MKKTLYLAIALCIVGLMSCGEDEGKHTPALLKFRAEDIEPSGMPCSLRTARDVAARWDLRTKDLKGQWFGEAPPQNFFMILKRSEIAPQETEGLVATLGLFETKNLILDVYRPVPSRVDVDRIAREFVTLLSSECGVSLEPWDPYTERN